jgi:putative transposase
MKQDKLYKQIGKLQTDITYIKLGKGFVYLVVIFDLYSRKILSWKVSSTMDTDFCVAALEKAIKQWGMPAIFNTDQGSQFTSDAFISVLELYGIRISSKRYHQSLDYATPDEIYDQVFETNQASEEALTA